MCLIAFDWQPDAAGSAHRLLLIANRDEFFDRPTAPLHWWDNHLLAGKDLREGGTWMGVTRTGRFAALTNYRSPNEKQAGKLSRGHLVASFLRSALEPHTYLTALSNETDRYNGFNLICGDIGQRSLWYYSNRSAAAPVQLAAGLYGLSNALLDTPWPKVNQAKLALKQAVGQPASEQLSALSAALLNDVQAPDDLLPSTGIATAWERRLSAMFIPALEDAALGRYGTRSSSVLRITEREAAWLEATVASQAEHVCVSFAFKL